MKNLRILLFIYPIALLFSCSSESTDNAQLDANISPVIPRVSSTIVDIKVEDNQQVKKGDILLMLDDVPFKLAVERAEIALMQAKKNLTIADINKQSASVNVANTQSSTAALEANLSAVESSIESAQEQLSVATKNFERYQTLLKQGAATQQQFDQMKAAKTDAEARMQSALSQKISLEKQIAASRYQVAGRKTQLSGSTENISMAELNVKSAENQLKEAQLRLSYCTIKAPVDGIVSQKNVELGQLVNIGSPLMAIADDTDVWVVANFKETQIEKMKPGQEVEVKVDTYSDQEFTGKIESIAQATGAKFSFIPADNATGNFVKVTQRIPVKILLNEYDKQAYSLKAGMSVEATVNID
ncbi:MAG: secretion protein HlyD [Thalassobius sp.]|nr:secretion protein HlyD [Thalassovita sp.]